MKEHDVIKDYWGNQLVPIPSSLLSKWRFPNETTTFFQNVGLPLDPEAGQRPYFERKFFPNAFERTEYELDHLVTIGIIDLDTGPLDICIHEVTGLVFIYEPKPYGESTPRLRSLNSSIDKLLHYMVLFFQRRPKLIELTEEKGEAFEQEVTALQERFQQIDPQALLDGESYWLMILDDMRDFW